MNIRINFGGFYNSHHEFIVEKAIGYAIGADDPETGEINGDKLWDFNQWGEAYTDYAQQWLDMLNSEIGTNFRFIELNSPNQYNFRTDEIYAHATTADCLAVFKAIKNEDIKSDVFRIIRDRTTSYDGYRAFYRYGDIFERDQWHFLIEFMLDALIERLNEDYPFMVEDYYPAFNIELLEDAC